MNKLVFAFALVTIPLISHAIALPDCELENHNLATGLLETAKRQSLVDERTLEVNGASHNGEVVTYSKDDPILVADLKLNRVITSVVPDKDLVLKSTNFLWSDRRIKAGNEITVSRIITVPDGRNYKALQISASSQIFLGNNGMICSKALSIASNVWIMGTLSQEPEAVGFESRTVEKAIGTGSLRIIFTGVQAGVISFQELWVDGSTVLSSATRNFDQFSKTVKIGPFDFQVVDARDGKISLKYEIPDHFPLKPTSDFVLKIGKLHGIPQNSAK